MNKPMSPIVLAVLLLMAGLPVWADSITPSLVSGAIPLGGSLTVTKTVTITPSATVPIDVFFLMDTTGSMGAALTSLTSGFSSIVTTISGLAADVHFGVGNYNDCADGPGKCSYGPLSLAYTRNQDLTADTTAVQTALSGLTSSGGGDYPESNLYGLNAVATTTSWRPGSLRFLFWGGDAPGWDPREDATEAVATANLVANNVEVFALTVGFGSLNDDPDGFGPIPGNQANRITAATGGSVLAGGMDEVDDLIIAAIEGALATYSNVNLGVVGLPAGVGVSWTPGLGHSGAFDRSIERSFDFDVTFTGLAPGIYDFTIDALVDGRAVATEVDHIVVGIPEPSTYLLFGAGLVALAAVRRSAKR